MLPTLLKRRGDLTHWFDDFDHFFSPTFSDSNTGSVHFPRVDIHEDENSYYIDADLPGLDKKDIRINIENNVLTVSGSRNDDRKEKKNGYYRFERQTGQFERSFHLGETVALEQATAEFEQGVLKVIVPKKEAAKPKQLDIQIK